MPFHRIVNVLSQNLTIFPPNFCLTISCESVMSEVIMYYQAPSFEMQADIFTSLQSISRAFRRVKYGKTSKYISQYFKERHLIIYLLSDHEIRCRAWGEGEFRKYKLN